MNPFRFLEVFESWGPYIDGELIREQSVSAFQKGHWQKEKPVLLGTVRSKVNITSESKSSGSCVCVCVSGTTSEEGVIFVYGVFTKPVSPVECTVYTTAIFKHHAIKILRKYLPLYTHADRRDMLAQVSTLNHVSSFINISHFTFLFRRYHQSLLIPLKTFSPCDLMDRI